MARGADLNAADASLGWTALIWAAKEGHAATVAALLEQGADPRVRDSAGDDALLWAARKGHAAIAEALLARGADPGTRDRDGLDAAQVARQAGHGALAARLEQATPGKPRS